MVCAAGNDGAKDLHNVKYSACYPQTICVDLSTRLEWPSMSVVFHHDQLVQ